MYTAEGAAGSSAQDEGEEVDTEEGNSLYIESALKNVKHLMHVEETRVTGDRRSENNTKKKNSDEKKEVSAAVAVAGFSPPMINKELLDALLEPPSAESAHNKSPTKDASQSKLPLTSLSPPSSSEQPQLTSEHPLLSGSAIRERTDFPVSPETNRSGRY